MVTCLIKARGHGGCMLPGCVMPHCRSFARRRKMLRQLVSGAGCVDDAGPSGRANPLQSLFTDVLDRSKQHEYLPEVRFRDANAAEINKEKIRSRSNIHLRHVFPDATPQVLQQQLHTFLQTLNISEPATAADDRKYREFLSVEPHQSLSGTDWAQEFQQHGQSIPSHRPAAHVQHPVHAPQLHSHLSHGQTDVGNAWADSFHQQENPQQWTEEFTNHQHPHPQQHFRHQQQQHQHHGGPAQAETHHPLQAWVSEYQSIQQQATADQPWAQQYLSETDNAWASEFAEQQDQHSKADKLMPEQLKALKGPQADDPLDDKTALSWVRQFNETADQPSTNSQRGQSDTELASEMQVVPEAENPFSHHPSPLQAGCKLQATGRCQDAALAFEAAAMTAPGNAEAWMRLGSCRFQLEQFGLAVPALRRAARLLSSTPQNATANMLQDSLWLLVQACTNTGKKAEAVQHMEALAMAKAAAAGSGALQAMQQAGTSLEPRLQALARALGGDASVYLLLGMLRTSKGKREGAADAYAAAVRISLDAPMLAELATALRGVGKHAEAERCCTAAVSARPDYQRGWLELGRSQAAQGNFAPACKSYLRALDINMESPGTWDSLSMAFVALGQFPMADLADQRNLKAVKSASSAF